MMIVASVRSVQYRIRSDKILCIHGNSSKCEKCLRLKNNGIAKEKNNKKINDEMLCIHEMLLISSYYSTLKINKNNYSITIVVANNKHVKGN